MAIFNRYVKLPESILFDNLDLSEYPKIQWLKTAFPLLLDCENWVTRIALVKDRRMSIIHWLTSHELDVFSNRATELQAQACKWNAGSAEKYLKIAISLSSHALLFPQKLL